MEQRLIDANLTLTQAWQNFYKQEDEHEKLYEDYDILRDRHFEQCGFECCQQTIVNAPTVEAIPKSDYENRLKVDRVAILDKIRAEIEQLTSRYTISRERGGMGQVEWSDMLIKESEVLEIIDKYKEESEK